MERQNKWFHTQMTIYNDFVENVKKWLVDAGQLYAQPDVECSEHIDVDNEEIGAGGSVSNISHSK